MQHLEVSSAVRPLKWSLGVKWLIQLFPTCISLPVQPTVPYVGYVTPPPTPLSLTDHCLFDPGSISCGTNSECSTFAILTQNSPSACG